MFYLPGHGAYFFSAGPVARRAFVQIGSVDGVNLEFTLDNENYSCKSDAQILLHSAQGEFWVYRDPNYKTGGNWTKSVPTNVTLDDFCARSCAIQYWWR